MDSTKRVFRSRPSVSRPSNLRNARVQGETTDRTLTVTNSSRLKLSREISTSVRELLNNLLPIFKRRDRLVECTRNFQGHFSARKMPDWSRFAALPTKCNFVDDRRSLNPRREKKLKVRGREGHSPRPLNSRADDDFHPP